MTEIFADGIRSIAVANGVTRIELLQLKRGQSQTKLEPEVVATLMIPVASLRGFIAQLASAQKNLSESAKAKGREAGSDVDSALENL